MGLGLGKRLVEYVTFDYPNLQGSQRFVPATLDAHDFYKRYGFQNLSMPDW
jgi:N-acetylglutamate synthase-like GNAT family acetyltransferase